MSSSIKNIDTLRNLYKSQASGTNEMIRELRQIKNEIKIGNDIKTQLETPITNATGSPYFKDQDYYNKNVLFNSPKETEWKNVPSYEENRQQALIAENLKKLNIL